MYIAHTDLEIQREPFARPFGFKGSAFHEKWNLAVRLRDNAGTEAFGLGGLAVLWSDADVFAAHTEVGGNVLQTALLEYALQQVLDRDFPTPMDILPNILPDVHEYGKTVTQNPDLRLTFSLIALVALDNAAWMLYARQNGIDSFDDLIPTVDDLLDLADDALDGELDENFQFRVIPEHSVEQCEPAGTQCSEETVDGELMMCCGDDCSPIHKGCDIGKAKGGKTCAICDGWVEAHIGFDFDVDVFLTIIEDLFLDAFDSVISGGSFQFTIPYTMDGTLFFDVPQMGRAVIPFGPFSDDFVI